MNMKGKKRCAGLFLVLAAVLMLALIPMEAQAAKKPKVKATIVTAVGRTNFITGPYTVIGVQIHNKSKKPVYMIGSPISGQVGNTWVCQIVDRASGNVVLNLRAHLSNEAGQFLVQAKIKKKAMVYFSITLPSFVGYQFITANYYAGIINDPDYQTRIYPYFSTKKVNKKNPLKTKPKYKLTISN